MKQMIIDNLQGHFLEVKPKMKIQSHHAKFKEDLAVDSLDMAEFIARVEQDYQIEIPDEDWPKIATMDLLADYIYHAKN